MPPKPKFQEGEKLLCYHGPLLYEAKCMKLDVRDGKVHYLIHYNGWNKNWDEWVQESRIVKNNEAGYQKQRELLKNHGALTKKTKTAKKLEKELLKQQKNQSEKAAKEKEAAKDSRKEKASTAKEKQASKEKEKKEKESKQSPATPQSSAADRKREREQDKEQKEKEKEKEQIEKDKDKEKKEAKEKASGGKTGQSSQSSSTQDSASSSQGASGEPKRKRARTDQSVESEESYLSKIEVKIKIPEDLKPVLVDDWDLITRQKMLVTVPCKMTVDEIIDEYVKTKCAKNANANKDAILETMLGCKDYFNVMLGPQLLYKFERPQYGEILSEHPDKPMSSIYGAIHFLRLFVRLGAMLAYTALDERTVHILLTHLHDFLKYMSKNGPNFFKISNYEIAPPDYHRKAI